MNNNYRIGYPKAFLGYGKFTCKKPTVNVCEKCPGLDIIRQEFEPDYELNLTICPLHFNQQLSARMGEQLIAA